MVGIPDTIGTKDKDLLQKAFLNQILQNTGLIKNQDHSCLFQLLYHPKNQDKKRSEIVEIMKDKHNLHYTEATINEYAKRIRRIMVDVFKQAMIDDGLELSVNLITTKYEKKGKPQNSIEPHQVTYQWLWEKKFPRMGWELAKEVAAPACNKLTMLDINENFEGEKSPNGGASNGSSKRGLVMNGTVIKPEPDKGNYIYLNKPHYLWVNLPDNGKYLLLINETVEGNFYLFSPSRAFAYVPYTKLSEGLRLPPSEGLARFFQYDAVGDEYFLAIVTEQPIDLSWVNGECDPTDIILNQERLEEIFVKLGQQGNSEVFYKRFKVVEQTINYSDQSATIISNKNLVYQGE
jgi:hypothetical protein